MIKFVYFDLGGVFILDFSGTNKWEELRRGMGVKPSQDANFEKLWSKYENEICVSRDVDTLIPILEKELGLKFSAGYSLLSDFVNRFEPNPSIWPIIDAIHKTTRVGLLTNAYPRMFEEIKKRGIVPLVDWDVVIDSSVVGLQKPDQQIYKLAQEKAGVKSEEILFVENSPGHVEAACNFGWQTFLYDPANPVKSSDDLIAYFRN